jgi:peptide/nickel transport system permease protein
MKRWKIRWSAKPVSWTGLILIFIFAVLSLFGNSIAPYSSGERTEPYLLPSSTHFLGTDDIGNDIFSELIHGTRTTLIVGVGAAVLASLLGLLIGITAGYFRGVTDELLMGLTDVFLMIPRIPLLIVLAAFLRPGSGMILLSLGLLWWTSTARVVRSKTLQVREAPYITGARALGFSHRHIILTDILPNILQVVLPKFMLTVAAAMISETSLSFLGLGNAAHKSWGMMISFAFSKGGVINGMWWWYLPPGLCISTVILAFVLLGHSLEEREER